MKISREMDVTRFLSITPRFVYIFSDILCLIAHILYIWFFTMCGVKEMVIFNIFSVTLYIVLAFLLYFMENSTLLICIALLEIITHACVATVFLGWGWGFALFIICIAPVPFFLDFKYDFIPYITTPIFVLIFILLKIYVTNANNVIYNIDDSAIKLYLYIFNSFFSFLLIIGISAIYRISKQITQYRLKEKNETLSKLATIDHLTQLFNRRAMIDFLKIVQDNSMITKQPYVIVMGDIDDFKRVNDTFGHSCGDMVLKDISKIMADTVPSEGYVCRWGGEELLFVIPNADFQVGTDIANEIREKVSKMSFKSLDEENFNVTITLGVCECNHNMLYEEGLKIADMYLYCGKKHGKNVVVNKNNARE